MALSDLISLHLIAAVKECFSTVLATDLSDNDQVSLPNANQCLVCSIGFAGNIEGSVVLVVEDVTACKIVEKMLSMPFTEITADVKDGFGEMGNMISGGFKNRMHQAGYPCNITVPTTMVGKNIELSFPKTVTHVARHFDAPEIRMDVRVEYKMAAPEQVKVEEKIGALKESALARLKTLVNANTKA